MPKSHLPRIGVEKETKKITNFIDQTFDSSGKSKAIIGVSGGVDSASVVALTVKSLGSEQVYCLIMPSLQSQTSNIDDAHGLALSLGIPDKNIQEINLALSQEAFAKTLDLYLATQPQNYLQARIGNVSARLRMMYLYDQAKALDALVIGTENRSEDLLGYFTRFGDQASDLEPIKHLYKTQVYQLARYLEIPKTIMEKAPSADLWYGQTDEQELGFDYQTADEIMWLYFDQNKSVEEIAGLGVSKVFIFKVLDQCKRSEFKHKTPYSL